MTKRFAKRRMEIGDSLTIDQDSCQVAGQGKVMAGGLGSGLILF
jgi:hypothetical protein